MKMTSGFIISLLLLFACSGREDASFSDNHATPAIEIVVHRGANRLAPENTMAAFKLAIEQGADYIEVDVSTSKDGVLYCFHDKTLDRTTNGTGIFAQQSSSYINSLDAGSWFSPEFAGETIPTVKDIVDMARGKSKIYFDIKDVDLHQLADFIKNEKLDKECFVWFSDRKLASTFQVIAPGIALKMNAKSAKELNKLLEEYSPKIIESGISNIDPELQNACEKHGIKLMANLLRDSWWEYEQAIKTGVDMVNIDHPDYFKQMLLHPEHKFNNHRLIAHRGGIVEEYFDEYDPSSIKAAIDSGYWMLEIDLRPTADKNIIVHHDQDLKQVYGVNKLVSEMTISELKELKSRQGEYSPLTFREVAEMCQGRTTLMLDIKPAKPEAWFCDSINLILEQYNLAANAWFIRNEVKEFFPKGKFGFRVNEAWNMKERLENGEDIVAHYYLFDHGNRINAETARWCQLNNIDVCASVNIGHYRMEEHYMGAKRDIEYLIKSGVTAFQIDSDYDQFFDLNK